MQRLNYFAQLPQAFAKLTEIEALVKASSLDPKLRHLVKLRASQINGCAFCVDMHVKEAMIDDERPLRLHHLAVWAESPLFSDKEKAALLWTESVTRLANEAVSDDIYEQVKKHFSDKEITELTLAVAMINLWNRFAAPFQGTPGSADRLYGLDKARL